MTENQPSLATLLPHHIEYLRDIVELGMVWEHDGVLATALLDAGWLEHDNGLTRQHGRNMVVPTVKARQFIASQQQTATAIAAGLSAEEVKRLKEWVDIDRVFVNEYEKDLERKGLIRIVRIDHRRHQNIRTDLGNRVLAALDTPAAADARPTVITAAEFVEQGYAENKQCKVALPHYPNSQVERLEKSNDHEGYFAHYINDFGEPDIVYLESDYKLWVRWLDTAAPAESGVAVDNSWKFRKLGAGISPTDYRETLSREGLLDYLKEREAKFEEIYQGEYDKRAALNTEIDDLRQQLAAAKAENARLREANSILTRFMSLFVNGTILWDKTLRNIQANDNEREMLRDSHNRFIAYGKEGTNALRNAALAADSGNREAK